MPEPIEIKLDPNKSITDQLKPYIGKHIATDCMPRSEWVESGEVSTPDTFGGDCGVLLEVYEEGGETFVYSDWGMAWVVTNLEPRIWVYEDEGQVQEDR